MIKKEHPLCCWRKLIVSISGLNQSRNVGAQQNCQLDVSEKVFHYKSSILGYPYFWKHPVQALGILRTVNDLNRSSNINIIT